MNTKEREGKSNKTIKMKWESGSNVSKIYKCRKENIYIIYIFLKLDYSIVW